MSILLDVFADCGQTDEWFMAHGFKTVLDSKMLICEQLGCPAAPTDSALSDWDDWMPDATKYPIAMVRDYLRISTTLDFDPPRSPTVLNAMEETRNMLEFRIRTHIEHNK